MLDPTRKLDPSALKFFKTATFDQRANVSVRLNPRAEMNDIKQIKSLVGSKRETESPVITGSVCQADIFELAKNQAVLRVSVAKLLDRAYDASPEVIPKKEKKIDFACRLGSLWKTKKNKA
jgi:hypothetical protein